jgi:hypothetical protein
MRITFVSVMEICWSASTRMSLLSVMFSPDRDESVDLGLLSKHLPRIINE